MYELDNDFKAALRGLNGKQLTKTKYIMTQREEILTRLIKGQRLTNLDGMRLTKPNRTLKFNTRISDYRQEGYPIDDVWIVPPSGKRVKQYFIKDENRLMAYKKFKNAPPK